MSLFGCGGNPPKLLGVRELLVATLGNDRTSASARGPAGHADTCASDAAAAGHAALHGASIGPHHPMDGAYERLPVASLQAFQ